MFKVLVLELSVHTRFSEYKSDVCPKQLKQGGCCQTGSYGETQKSSAFKT